MIPLCLGVTVFAFLDTTVAVVVLAENLLTTHFKE
jgi:hypothetical protein